jgi:cytochrome c oxidase assembly protein subunit 15
MRLLRLLSSVATVETFLVIVLAKIVGVTGASKSIPTWPLAFGKFIPPMSRLVFLEWSHRLLALLLVVTLVALAARAARLSRKLCAYCVTSLLLVIATAVLGGAAVLRGESIALAACGQALAMLSFASLVGLTVWAHMVAPGRAGKRG